MLYKEVDTRKKYAQMEHEQIQFWRDDHTFEKSIEARPAENSYVFYDGPPFITGDPHYGTLLSSIIKDVVPRYWTMKGKRVERTWGWDCHGLPAENRVEKKLGLKDKRDVEKIGLEKYIETCHSEMVRGSSEWEDIIERIGRWVEFKGAYKTMDNDYMESVWWAFKELHTKGKIYEGEKVLLYCTRCGTPVSKAEVAMDNSYRDVSDPSVYVKFQLADEADTYLLAWTTTPWTLVANTALAVNQDVTYVRVNIDGQTLILAQDLVEKVMTDEKHQPLAFELGQTISGKDLIGKRYIPLFEDRGEGAHSVHQADYVTTADGTGVVHLAPAYGEEDFDLAKVQGIPVVHSIDGNGLYTEGQWIGEYVWDMNKPIAKKLFADGTIFKIDYIMHEYPHCHRCDTKLMYRAHPSWFMDIAHQRDRMLESNEEINWFPEHFKHKRFKNIVSTAPDWNLSRDRFWATPFPVWKCAEERCDAIHVCGSFEELTELSGVKLKDYHRPYVDDVTFACASEDCTGTMKRIDKVLDCWFESGSMPFAQFHYPFENKQKFEENFPGDFISEYVGQVRAWFYYLHAVSIGLFGEKCFKNVIVTGTIAGNDGKKMSKSLGNYTDPNVLIEKTSADALRFLLVSSPLLNGEDYAMLDKDVTDVQRKLATLWQSYGFFVMYANIDGWKHEAGKAYDAKLMASHTNILDKWVVSRLHETIAHVDKNLEAYNLPDAMKPLLVFVDDLSNWYIRRSRKRFWKSQDDADKEQAYATLHYVLTEFSKLIAPVTPFIAEEIYRNLMQTVSEHESGQESEQESGQESSSVHLTDYPVADPSVIDQALLTQMSLVRDVISEGLKLRARAQLKVRQPLASITLRQGDGTISSGLCDVITEEMNVKQILYAPQQKDLVVIDVQITPELKVEGQAREIIRFIQQARKKAGFEIDDRIVVGYEGLDDVFAAHGELITHEVLASDQCASGLLNEHDFADDVVIDQKKLQVTLKKV